MSKDGFVSWEGRPVWAEIELEAIAHNIRHLKRRVEGAELLAVVKANGYGHGAVAVARAALEAGASFLGVACADEGIQLRAAGVAAPILIMGYCPPWEAEKIVSHNLTPSVTTKQGALALARQAAALGVSLPIHVKVDTGMARFGLEPQEVAPFVKFLSELAPLKIEGLYTHFAAADEADKTFTEHQFGIFTSVAQGLPPIPRRHVANSATILDLPDMKLDLVRPGISIYGLLPSARLRRPAPLRPALSLKSCIARLHWLKPGDSVSYGRTWVAERPTRLALVPCGYADGLPRALSNKGSVLIRGRRAPIRGRVCMDQCLVEVTDIPEAALNDEVVIIGRQGEAEISADEVAALADTISYEILCGISARVPRVYLKGGEIVEVETLVEAKGHRGRRELESGSRKVR